MIDLDQDESPPTLYYGIHGVYLKELTSLLHSWYNPFSIEPSFSLVYRVKM